MIPIRRLDPPLSGAEAEALSALHGRAFAGPGGERGWSAAEMFALAEGAGALTLVAGEAAAPLGFALFRVAADEAELLTIATRPESRRSGAAKAILAAAPPFLNDLGAAVVFLEVARGNAPARALYESAGFMRIAIRADYYAYSDGRRDDALIYRLQLNQQAIQPSRDHR